MGWANEPYVKVYTRETDDDLLLSWEARALWDAMMKKFDRSGLIETRRGDRGLAAVVRMPLEVVARVLPELLEDGRLTQVPNGYFAPNFMAAQEASKSDRLRQRESRMRRAELARSSEIRSEPNTDVTNRDRTSRDVTSGHAASHYVTLCSADPIPLQSEPLLRDTHALSRDPGPPPVRSSSADPEPARDASALQSLKQQVDATAPEVNARLAHPRPAPDPRIKLNHDAWAYAADTHRRLRAAGVDANAVAWTAMPSGAAAGDIVERTREILANDPDIQRALAVHRRRVDVAAEEAQHVAGHLKWFTPSRIYNRESFWKAAEMDPRQVRRSPRSQAGEAGPLRVGALGADE